MKLGRKNQERVVAAVSYVVMGVLAFLFVTPVVLMFVSSIKNDEFQVITDMSSYKGWIPYGDLGVQNFFDVFKQVAFDRFLFNSFFIVSTTVILGLIVNSLVAYALARFRFPGRKVILPVIIALIIVPFETVAIPMLLLVNRLPWIDGSVGWLDTYHVQIIPFIVDVLMIFLFYQFFIGFPIELEEAAIVDGANRFQIFYRIVLPLSGPIFSTVAILTFLHRWGDYMWPLMVTRGPEVRPVMVGYQAFFGMSQRVQWGDIMAYGTMATLPVLVLFILLQRSFIASIASTGIKG